VALAFLVLFGLRPVRVNTGSIYSGVVGILTLYRTARARLSREFEPPLWPMEKRRAALLAGAAVVTTLVRTNLVATALPFGLLVIGSDFLRGTRRPWQRPSLASLGRVLAVFAAVTLVAMLPWSLMQRQSCGTFFYPLGHDNLTPGLTFLSKDSRWTELLVRFFSNTLYGKPLAVPLLFLLAGMTPLAARSRNDLFLLTVATLLCLAVLARSGFPAEDTARYDFAPISVAALVTVASVGAAGPLTTLAAVAVATHLGLTIAEWPEILTARVHEMRAAYVEKSSDRAAWDKLTNEYLEVQSHVPAGATIVAATPENFRFDFRRNRIFVLDALGAMGPKPGWPVHKSPEVLAQYLRDNGVSYVIRIDFDAPGELYNRAHWRDMLAATGSTISVWAAPHLEGEEALEGLSAVGKNVFVGHEMTVVDLAPR
jgi:hypothetical protein